MTIDTSDDTPAVEPTAKKTPRPRNRKAQIITVAREQFGRRGYHGVNMEDIASAVGITAGALYRHFPNKQDLLAQAILNAASSIMATLDDIDPEDSAANCLALLRYCLDNDFRAVLFDQESRNLVPERRTEVRTAVQSVVARIAGALRAERPDLTAADADVLAWALSSVALSPARHRTTLPRKRLESLLLELCERLRSAPILHTVEVPAEEAHVSGFAHASRRETLLTAAISLFRRRGYQSVTMDDIGAGAGMASSSIYTYFGSKVEVLQAILSRGNETLRMGLVQALAGARSREDALSRVVHSYATAVSAPDSAIGILIEESTNLPAQAQSQTLTAQREYIDEWVHLLGADTHETRTTVLAAIDLINALSRLRHLHARPQYRDEIEDLALRVLGVRTD
ncbi:TetR/AcrR family transcriptional regulator [Rhodococcus sp. NPDC127530]|uniref:TetR/AcrR family transcriptional regulator n=1 Tax=unclassified Rhodococcus (in: high G+C Gram-positive bacteria) TaxID=192944 RepID=UPI0036355152